MGMEFPFGKKKRGAGRGEKTRALDGKKKLGARVF